MEKIYSIEKNLKKFIIEKIKIVNEKEKEKFDLLYHFKLNKLNFEYIIDSMELGTFLKFISFSYDQNLFPSIFNVRNAALILNKYFSEYKNKNINSCLRTNEWEKIFLFLHIFTSFRNMIFHFNTWSWGIFEGIISLILFYNKRIYKKSIINILIKKEKEKDWEITCENTNFYTIVSDFF